MNHSTQTQPDPNLHAAYAEQVAARHDATSTFVSRKAQIDAMLERLAALSADHFNVDPDKLTWADVGTLGKVMNDLRHIEQFLDGTAE